jgi:hypothetical protein
VAFKAGVEPVIDHRGYGVVAYAAEGGWFGQLFGITTPN